MKKIIYSVFVAALSVSAVSCIKIDNWNAPDARFYGRIIDKETGEVLLCDQGHGNLRLWEMSFSDNPAHQDIPIKQDGSFNNHRLFAGDYDVLPMGAWWPCDTIRNVLIGKSGTELDVKVVPNLRVIDFETELVGTTLKVSCRLEAPVAEGLPIITDVRPFLSLNQFCGDGNKLDYYNNGNTYRIKGNASWNSLPKDADGKASRMVSPDIDVKPGYTYFVRIGARVDDRDRRYNYSEIKVINVPLQ